MNMRVNYFGTRKHDKYGLFWDDEQFVPGAVDSRFAPRIHGGRDEAPQGVYRVVFIQGWTLVAFWDRSGDPRGNCNSCFAARGMFSAADILKAAEEQFPWAKQMAVCVQHELDHLDGVCIV